MHNDIVRATKLRFFAVILLGLTAASLAGPWAADRAAKRVANHAFAADAVGLSEELGVDWEAERRKARAVGFGVGIGVPLLLTAGACWWIHRRGRLDPSSGS